MSVAVQEPVNNRSIDKPQHTIFLFLGLISFLGTCWSLFRVNSLLAGENVPRWLMVADSASILRKNACTDLVVTVMVVL